MPASAPEDWPAESRVVHPRSTVTVDGLPGRCGGFSVRREISTDLPDQVRGVSGMSIASADVTWLPESPVVPTGAWSPYGDRRVTRSDVGREVDISIGRDDARVGLFHGRVQDSSASTDNQVLDLDCDEITDPLLRPAVLEPLAHQMPSPSGGTLTCGLTPAWALHRVLANAGYHSVPPPLPGVMLDVPLQGSLWPHLGRMTAGAAATDAARWPGVAYRHKIHRAPDGTETQIPDSYITAWSGTSAAISVWEPGAPPGNSTDALRVGLFFGGTGTVDVTLVGEESTESPTYTTRIRITPNTLRVRRESSAGPFDEQTTPWVGRGPVEFALSRLLGPSGFVANRAWWDGGSWESSLDTSVPVRAPAVVTLSVGTGSYVAGLQVGTHAGSDPWGYVAHQPTADLDGTVGTLEATPGIGEADETTAWDALQSIAAAELGGFWIDEEGRPRFRNRRSLRGIGVTARPVTARHDIKALSWTERAEATSGSVEVPYQPMRTLMSPSGRTDILVWHLDKAVRVEANGRWVRRVWARLNATAIGLDLAMKADHYGVGEGSGYRAISRTDGVSRSVRASARQTSPRVVLLEFSSWPRTNPIYVLLDPSGDPWAVLRARMSVVQDGDSGEHSARSVADPDRDDVFSLPTSPWRQSAIDAQELADWLAGDMRKPAPVLQPLSIVPDPLIQLGDKVEITAFDDLRVVGIVAGYTWSEDADGLVSQELTVRPIPVTFADFDVNRSGDTFADFDADHQGDTFADFDADPEEIN